MRGLTANHTNLDLRMYRFADWIDSIKRWIVSGISVRMYLHQRIYSVVGNSLNVLQSTDSIAARRRHVTGRALRKASGCVEVAKFQPPLYNLTWNPEKIMCPQPCSSKLCCKLELVASVQRCCLWWSIVILIRTTFNACWFYSTVNSSIINIWYSSYWSTITLTNCVDNIQCQS